MYLGGGGELQQVSGEVYLACVASAVSLSPEVDADARLGSTEAQAAAARVIAHQAHGTVLGRTARERRIHPVTNLRESALAQEFVESRLVLHGEGRPQDWAGRRGR